jgi:PAS domain S-box-containing protein
MQKPGLFAPNGQSDAVRAKVMAARAPEAQILLERAEIVARIGSWQWRPDTDALLWSDNAFRLLGLEPGEVIPSREYVLEHTHPDDRERVAHLVESLGRSGALPPVEYRYIRPDGAMRHLRSTVTAVETGPDGPRLIVGVVQDVTDQRRAELQIAAHVAVAEALEEWDSFDTGGERLLSRLGEAMGYEVGVLWLPVEDQLVARLFWTSPALNAEEFATATRKLRLRKGAGVPGTVWESREPLSVADVRTEQRHAGQESAAAVGLCGAIVLPALHSDEVLAVLEFYFRQGAEPSRRLLRTAVAIGYELGQFLSHRRGQLQPVPLTARELEVLQLAAQGHSGREIARQLVLAHSTVKTHLQHIYEKLGVRDRASAVAHGLRQGVIR